MLINCKLDFSIGLSSSALERRVLAHAQCALVIGLLILVLVVVLARKSRMVVNVAICTIHSFILRLLVEVRDHCEDPLDALLGFVLGHLLGLRDWTRMFF